MSNTIMAPAPSQDRIDADRESRRIKALIEYSRKMREQEQWEREHPRPFLGFDPYKD